MKPIKWQSVIAMIIALVEMPMTGLATWDVVPDYYVQGGMDWDYYYDVDGDWVTAEGYLYSYFWSGAGGNGYYFHHRTEGGSYDGESFLNGDYAEFYYMMDESEYDYVEGRCFLLDSDIQLDSWSSY